MKVLAKLEDLLARLATLLTYFATASAVAITAFVVLSAVMRYFFKAPFHFTEELVALLLLAAIFLTLPQATSRGEHIRVLVLLQAMPPAVQRAMEAFAAFVIALFAAIFALHASEFLMFAWSIDAKTEQTRLLLWPWLLLMPASAILVCAIALLQLLRRLCGLAAR